MNADAGETRIRRPVGAVLSVRVPSEVAAAVDDYATAHGLTLSEAVRVALDHLLSGGWSSRTRRFRRRRHGGYFP